jgi:hypothetical protein
MMRTEGASYLQISPWKTKRSLCCYLPSCPQAAVPQNRIVRGSVTRRHGTTHESKPRCDSGIAPGYATITLGTLFKNSEIIR